MRQSRTRTFAALALTGASDAVLAAAPQAAALSAAWPAWVWPLALFLACFLMGLIAVPAGIGGGTLFLSLIHI